ncbi:unnamed protein product [Medioppia subpectinata]|uniref:Pseudouridine synthase II N-terminal domain-containing protein n=1 Tax=Medioppia subpectinata TaxID=1979941 RepID=A0A7R9L390_9ACAR|nr:unnamed protein product [Medioppia subpectinata]CAG2113566.1 unnamed protein product [Medioppia subpectinata]
MPSFELRYAPYVWRLLNGVFVVHKPHNKTVLATRRSLLKKLCDELNSMECRPPRELVHISGQLSSGESLKVETRQSFADDPLVVGQRYQPQDFSLSIANNPGFFASGVVVVFMGRMAKSAADFQNGQHLRVYEMKGRFGFATDNCRSDGKIIEKVYEMKGRFGFATDNCRSDGKIIEKSRFKHVTERHIGRVISKIQANHQTLMFKTMGVDLKSQEAYELAAKGMVRPAVRKTTPIIYGIRLTEFSPPDFTVEVECINEFDEFLYQLIHGIALKLRTSAMCTRMRVKRYGPFTTEDSLLMKHWTSEHIIENIEQCKHRLQPHVLQPISAVLSDPTALSDHDIFLDTLKRSGEIIK